MGVLPIEDGVRQYAVYSSIFKSFVGVTISLVAALFALLVWPHCDYDTLASCQNKKKIEKKGRAKSCE